MEKKIEINKAQSDLLDVAAANLAVAQARFQSLFQMAAAIAGIDPNSRLLRIEPGIMFVDIPDSPPTTDGA
jgi:hypothetical protein